MNRWFMLLVIALAAPLFFVTGCTITGQTSGVPDDGLVECSVGARISFLTINDQVQACYKGSGLYFVVENTGTAELTGLSVTLESDYDVTMDIRERAGPGETVQQSLSFGSQGLEGTRSMTVYPFIGDGEARRLCSGAGVTAVLVPC